MILYAETSAVLSWLVGERAGSEVRAILARASAVVASELTGLECQRAISRWTALGGLREADAAALRSRLASGTARWTRLAMGGDVVERAGLPYPEEPVRALDAIHLATALLVRRVQPDLQLLSLDDRVRRCARALGFEVLPAAPA